MSICQLKKSNQIHIICTSKSSVLSRTPSLLLEFLPTYGKFYNLKKCFCCCFGLQKIFPDSSEDIIIQVLHCYERAYVHFRNKNKKNRENKHWIKVVRREYQYARQFL